MAGRDLIMNGWDFLDDWSRFYHEKSRFSWWQVEIFTMTGRDFTMNGRDFCDESWLSNIFEITSISNKKPSNSSNYLVF